MFSSRFSPDVEERKIIALLLVAGEQFDAFKKSVLGRDSTETIYSAIWTMRMYTKNADYVNQSKWPLVVQIAKDFQYQIDKFIDSIGQRRVDVYEGATDNDFRRFNVPSGKYSVEIGDCIKTIFPRPFGRRCSANDASLIKQTVAFLSQPSLGEIKISNNETRSTEEPSLSSRPLIRVARPRRHSMSPLDETSERGLYQNEKFDDENEDNGIVNDIAFTDHEVTERVFCKKSDVTMKERFDCSCSFARPYYPSEDTAHSECRNSAIDNWRRIGWSKVYIREERTQKREFEFIDKSRKDLFLKQ